MIKRNKAKILIAFISLFLLLVLFGQLFSNSFIISGKITSESGLTSGAEIDIYKDGRRENNIKINSNGKFNLPLEFNHEYTLVFSREDCFSKKLVVSTIVPDNILKENPEFPVYEIEQSLFSEIKGIDKTFSENTIEKVYYNRQIDNFVSQVFYNDDQIQKQIEEAILKAEQLAKAGARIDKQESEALKLLRKEYDRYIEEAGQKFNAGEYPKALSDYMAASKLFPEEQFPKDRINEINDLMAALKYSDGQQPEDSYSSLIAAADNSFDQLLWTAAKEKYQQALLAKPNDTYARNRIQQINAIVEKITIDDKQYDRYRRAIVDGDRFKNRKQFLRAEASYNFALSFNPGDEIALKRLEEVRMFIGESEEDKEYNKFIVQADEYFRDEDYKKSMRNYEQASAIKPAEQYPINQIEEIKAILSGAKSAALIDKEYAAKIKDADNAFNSESYEQAKNLYGEALALKSDERYPATKIREIDRILADINAAKSRDEQYAKLIAQADGQFDKAEYEASKENYVAALKLKNNEQHPQDRIREINRLLVQLEQTIASYNNAIRRADAHFENKNYDNALAVYKSAKEIKPDETYPDDMIVRIQSIIAEEARLAAEAEAAEEARLLAAQQQKNNAYDELIAQGDNLYITKEYVQAIGKYRSALDFKPGAQYPIQKIEEIRGFIAQIAATQKAYDDAIARADRNFNREIYDAAKLGYAEAREAKPDEVYPDEMIAKIDSIEKAIADKLAQDAAAEAERIRLLEEQRNTSYNNAIAQGDAYFNNKEYQPAITSYKEALDVKPEETYPQTRITEIEALIAQIAATQKAYDDAIARADRNYNREIYDAAKLGYAEAKQAKPDEVYPDEMIAKIDSIEKAIADKLAQDAAAEAERLRLLEEQRTTSYNNAIAQGDAYFNNKEYQPAITSYKEALDVKPEETYPQTRITEIEALVAQIAATQKAYDDAIARADRNFSREIYDAAKLGYAEAKQAKPDEVYPDEMIAKIDSTEKAIADKLAQDAAAEAERLRLLEEQRTTSYNNAIAQGDAYFNNKEYQPAITSYKEALDVKPEETYPQTRITEIEALVAQIAATQKAYDDAIARADRNFSREIYDAAKLGYAEAKQAKPDEVYPDEMIAKIDSIEKAIADKLAQDAAAEAERLRLLEEQRTTSYNNAIAQGDAYFNNKEYQPAITSYKEALDVKPEETYPQTRITEIEALIAQIAATQKAYDDAIARADRNYNREIYDAAKLGYAEAKEAKPDEVYPDEMIAKIDSIEKAIADKLAQDAAAEAERIRLLEEQRNTSYNNAIAQGDAYFNNKEYQPAITSYKEALDVKPEETYPQTRITEIEALVAQIAATQKAYDDAIARADRNYNREIYDAAKLGYAEAKEAKPDEVYPDEMIAKIDSIEKAIADKLAQDAAAEAERIRLLEEQRNTSYNNAIAQGDAYFNNKEYQPAITSYKEALDVKPEETYPQTRITEIEALVAQIAATQKAYDDAIARADRNYNREIYDAAKLGYAEAKEAKPDEVYPDEMIAKIDSIENALAEQLAREAAEEAERLRLQEEQRNQAYNSALAQADAYFNDKDYKNATAFYKEALDVKPEELYPQEQLNEINRLEEEILAIENQYRGLVKDADGLFSRKNYEDAKAKYNEALALKNNEEYPKSQLTKIDQVLASLAKAEELENRYNAAIQQGDNSFEAQNYNESITAYESALVYKPGESYPKERIVAAKNKLQQIEVEKERLRGIERAYQNAITLADEAFLNKNYDAAETKYKEANSIKPDEEYPIAQLAKMEQQIAAEIKARYDAIIEQANIDFNAKNYSDARVKYSNALIIVAEDAFATKRIEEIDRILNELADAEAELRRIQQEYMSAITQGDEAYQLERYPGALGFYRQANALKPNEDYPKIRISELENLIQAQKAEEDYRRILLVGDEYFKLKQYNESRAEYMQALRLKPEEDYPAAQIHKIDEILREIERARLIAEQQAAESIAKTAVVPTTSREIITQQGQFDNYLWNQMMNAYNGFLNQADEAFSTEEYNISRFYYQQALSVFPEEIYPKEKIKEIRTIINARLSDRLEREYQQSIDAGDEALAQGNLTIARFHYNKALALKPREKYPRLQVDEIRDRLDQAQSQRTNEEYQDFLRQADEAFNNSNLSVARYYYTKASYLKPVDQYPIQQLQKIENLLNELNQGSVNRDPE